jgi:hypothetical protein
LPKTPFFDSGFYHARSTDGFKMDIVPDMPAVWRGFDQNQKRAGMKGWKCEYREKIRVWQV